MTDFHVVYFEDDPVLFGLSNIRHLGLFIEHPLVFIESEKTRPVHIVRRSVNQCKKYFMRTGKAIKGTYG